MAGATGEWTAPSGNGVYWRGADGNVYVKGDQGVNNAGQWDDNSGTYWGDRGFDQINDPNVPTNGWQQGSSTSGTQYGTGGTSGTADDISFLDDQQAQLQDLLGRTEGNLNQGLTRNQDQYDTAYGGAQGDKQRQYANYQDQRVKTNKDKQNALSTIDRNAGQGYNNLAQIIGRSAGTGSSAFRDLLPSVVGKDTSAKRTNAINTSGENLQGIDKAQGQYDISFEGVLGDLLKQKKDNEDNLRSKIEEQRQGLNSQLSGVAGQRAQAQGGGYAQVKAAQQQYQDAINNSRNTVQGFFDQFRTQYTPKQAVATTPELAQYNTDRSQVNAGQQGLGSQNPYESLLRKRLQGQA